MAAAPAADPAAPSSAPSTPTAAEFEAFDRFPWSRHRSFLQGLIETLGGVDALVPSATHEGSCVFCRTVFFRMQTSRRVDLQRYEAFRAADAAYPSIDRRLLTALYAAVAAVSAGEAMSPEDRARRVVEAVARGPLLNAWDGRPEPMLGQRSTTAETTTPSWMRSAPTEPLHVDKVDGPASEAPTAMLNSEAPLSESFAAVVAAIQTGQPLEGIRQIPDTVVRRPGISPVGRLQARPKPWETADSGQTGGQTGGQPSILSFLAPDAEQHTTKVVLTFPPVSSAETDDDKHEA